MGVCERSARRQLRFRGPSNKKPRLDVYVFISEGDGEQVSGEEPSVIEQAPRCRAPWRAGRRRARS